MISVTESQTAAPPRKKYRTLAGGVVERIVGDIQQGALKPGDKLPTESAIMAQYGVSRTVVREALSHLQAGRWVQTRHGIGTFVIERPKSLGIDADSIITVKDVLAMLELRISMEAEAAWLAASRRSDAQVAELGLALKDMQRSMERGKTSIDADRRFHLLVAEATGNRYFVEILSQLGNTIIPRARLNMPELAHDDPSAYLQRVNREHEDIYHAILRADPEAARAAMRTHLSNSRERLRQAQQDLESAR
ncbi:MAG: FadR/GntR family transcriptional regulator [Gammaproteobacteria bacterium]